MCKKKLKGVVGGGKCTLNVNINILIHKYSPEGLLKVGVMGGRGYIWLRALYIFTISINATVYTRGEKKKGRIRASLFLSLSFSFSFSL